MQSAGRLAMRATSWSLVDGVCSIVIVEQIPTNSSVRTDTARLRKRLRIRAGGNYMESRLNRFGGIARIVMMMIWLVCWRNLLHTIELIFLLLWFFLFVFNFFFVSHDQYV